MNRIVVFGAGYVGLVAAACFAEAGNLVTGVDVNAKRVQALCDGKVPIYEPGLSECIHQAIASGSLSFTTQAAEALQGAEVIFIAVGTPEEEDGSADIQHVLAVAKTIGEHLTANAIVVNKSTVPVGTCEKVSHAIAQALAHRGLSFDVQVVSNPEFLREGRAMEDFRRPDRVVVGAYTSKAAQVMRQLYAPFCQSPDDFVVMQPRSAELTKYAANAMLATKISFINEIANLAEKMGADVQEICDGIKRDVRIGPHFIDPGCGYGGSCFPKDVKALCHMAKASDYNAPLLEAIETVNARQKRRPFEKLMAHYGGDLTGKVIAIWGLAFKPDTDDTREAPSEVLIPALLKAGASIQAFDPQATLSFSGQYQQSPTAQDALEGAHALVLMTQWSEFVTLDLSVLDALHDRVVVDARNFLSKARLLEKGFTYYGVGAPGVVPEKALENA